MLSLCGRSVVVAGGQRGIEGDRGASRRGWDGIGKMAAAGMTSVGLEWGANL